MNTFQFIGWVGGAGAPNAELTIESELLTSLRHSEKDGTTLGPPHNEARPRDLNVKY